MGELDHLLRQGVQSRLLSDSPIGLLCSGGLDSSLITSIATQLSDTPLLAFSATFPGQPKVDERFYAEMVCNSLGIEYIPVELEADSFKTHLVECVAHYGYPLTHESVLALAQIAKKANALGIKALLSGEAADELFGGYGSRNIALRQAFQGDAFQPPEPRHHPWMKYLPEFWTTASRAFESRNFDLLANAYADNKTPNTRAQLEAGIAADLYHFLSHGLNRLDKNMMQFSVEIREPFLHIHLLKYVLNLPLEFRIYPKLKGILREVARAYIPEKIIQRKKLGFNFDVLDMLGQVPPEFLQNGYLRECLEISKQDWKALCLSLSKRSLLRFLSGEVWCRLFLLNQKVGEVTNSLQYFR